MPGGGNQSTPPKQVSCISSVAVVCSLVIRLFATVPRLNQQRYNYTGETLSHHMINPLRHKLCGLTGLGRYDPSHSAYSAAFVLPTHSGTPTTHNPSSLNFNSTDHNLPHTPQLSNYSPPSCPSQSLLLIFQTLHLSSV